MGKSGACSCSLCLLPKKKKRRKSVDAVGPCSSSRWNPELDSIVVGLSIRTFGVAATAGTDDVAPIFYVPDVDCSDPCCDLDIGCPGGDVVSGRSSWHCFLVLRGTICLLSCSVVDVGAGCWCVCKWLGEGVRRTDGFEESSPSYVRVAVCRGDYVRVPVLSFPHDLDLRVPFACNVVLHPCVSSTRQLCVALSVLVPGAF